VTVSCCSSQRMRWRESGARTRYWQRSSRVGWSRMRVSLSIEKPECSQLRIFRAKSGFSRPLSRNRATAWRRQISVRAAVAPRGRRRAPWRGSEPGAGRGSARARIGVAAPGATHNDNAGAVAAAFHRPVNAVEARRIRRSSRALARADSGRGPRRYSHSNMTLPVFPPSNTANASGASVILNRCVIMSSSRTGWRLRKSTAW
jgi:hypothetical protein